MSDGIKRYEEELYNQIHGRQEQVQQPCPCDTKNLLAHIEEDDKTFNMVIDEMNKAIEDDKKLKAQLLSKEIIP